MKMDPCRASAFFSTLSMTCPRSVVMTRRARLLFWPWFGPWDRCERQPTWERRRSRLATNRNLPFDDHILKHFEAILWHPSSERRENFLCRSPAHFCGIDAWCSPQEEVQLRRFLQGPAMSGVHASEFPACSGMDL